MSDDDIEPLSEKLEAFLAPERSIAERPPAARARVLEAIARSVGPSGGGGPPPFSPSAPGALRALGLAALAGAIVGSAVTAALFTTSRSDPRVEPRPLPGPVHAAPSPVPSIAPPASTEPQPEPAAIAEVRRPPSPREPIADLAQEQRILDAARSAAVRGNLDDALAALDRHARRFEDGQLAQERESLRVQVLSTLGRREEAHEVAGAFRRRWPDSVFLPAIEAALPP